MNNIEGIAHLKSIINKTLRPLIKNRCVLYDTPFYKNIGDVLIWQGELSFIKENNIELLDYCDYHTYVKKNIGEDTCILFQGGGNMGDLYHEHVEFLLRLIEDYPNNRIIVLSQTVFYNSEVAFNRDFDVISKHKDLFFVARDYISFEKVAKKLGDRALVLPDMAFCININEFVGNTPEGNGKLYIKRNDKEAPESLNNLKFDMVSDWPCFEKKMTRSALVNTIYDRVFRYLPFIRNIIRESWKRYAYEKFRLLMIRDGVQFLSPYNTIVSERLHGCILAILLNKEVVVVNNSYGKNMNFYNAWLNEFDDVKLM